MNTLNLFSGKEREEIDVWIHNEAFSENRKLYDRYDRVSAYHKELRLGNIRNAKYWAGILGREKAETYLKNIVFEETCNFNLYQYCADKTVSFTEKLLAFCGTPKKWAHEARLCYFDRVKQLPAVQADSVSLSSKTLPKALRDAWEKKDYVRLSQLFWQYSYSHYTVRNALWSQLARDFQFNFIRSWKSHEQISLMRLHCFYSAQDHADFTVNHAKNEKVNAIQVKPIPLYAFDMHTRKGKQRIGKYSTHIKPDTPLPEDLDLRYSGAGPFVWWRCLAFDQHLSIKVPWEAVQYPDKEFQLLSLT